MDERMSTKIFILSDGVWNPNFGCSGSGSGSWYRFLALLLEAHLLQSITHIWTTHKRIISNLRIYIVPLSHKQASSKATIWDDDDVICGGYVAAEVWWPQNNLYAMSTQGTPTPPQSNPTAIADISHYRYYRRWRTFFNPAYFLAERT